MSLICLFGPDGSGKSTLAKAIAEEFRRRNLKITISWIRGTHTIASVIAKFLSKFAIFSGPDNPYYSISIPAHLRQVWQLIEFTSMLPILSVRFLLLSVFGYVVVAERYLPDFLAWVSITTKDPNYLKRFEARFMLALSSKAKAKFYITASKTELIKRRGNETSSEFIDKQLKIYDYLAKLINAHRIDTTNKTVEETLNQLLSLIPIRS